MQERISLSEDLQIPKAAREVIKRKAFDHFHGNILMTPVIFNTLEKKSSEQLPNNFMGAKNASFPNFWNCMLCVCVPVCMWYVCMFMFVCVCVHFCLVLVWCVCVNVFVYVCMCMPMCACGCVCVCVCGIWECIFLWMCVYGYQCVHVCMCCCVMCLVDRFAELIVAFYLYVVSISSSCWTQASSLVTSFTLCTFLQAHCVLTKPFILSRSILRSLVIRSSYRF